MTEAPERERALARLDQIRRDRKLKTVGGALSWIAVGQLLFASFAFGHSRGPMPLGALELFAGMGLALLFGGVLAAITARRRLENQSDFVVRLAEGRHRRRVAVFSDFFTIDQEVVLEDTIEKVEVEDERLVLRYVDPRFNGPVLRELVGEASLLEKLSSALSR